MQRRWGGVLVRGGIALLIVVLIMFMPLPGDLPFWVGLLQTAIGVLLLIVVIGKLLYDTFFYNRYWP